MGGLIAADVMRKLLDLNRDETEDLKVVAVPLDISETSPPSQDDPSEPAPKSKGWLGTWWERKNDIVTSIQPLEESKQIPYQSTSPVYIAAIIAFDSPFYGLSSNITRVASSYSIDVISSYLPQSHQKSINSSIKYGGNVALGAVEALPGLAVGAVGAIPSLASNAFSTVLLPVTNPKLAVEYITYPIVSLPSALSSVASIASTSVSTLWGSKTNTEPANEVKVTEVVLEQIRDDPIVAVEKDVLKSAETSTPSKLLEIPQETDWTPWVSFGLTTAALATGAYLSGGLLAIGGMTAVRQIALAYGVSQAEVARRHLLFLYPLWGESRGAAERRVGVLEEESRKGYFLFKCYYVDIPREGGTSRSFIRAPPRESVHFEAVGSDFDNEIVAHVRMFGNTGNGCYASLVEKTSLDVLNVIKMVGGRVCL